MGGAWQLTALVPLPAEAVAAFVPGLDVEITVPAERTPESARAALADAEIVLSDWSGLLHMDAAAVAAAPNLAFVQQPSVGIEVLDLAALAAAGVPAANCAGANAMGVAEWCVTGALAACKSIGFADRAVRKGEWPQLQLAEMGCVDLHGRRVGIVGFGQIGAICAERFAAFGCPVSYWSRRERTPEEARGATYADLDTLVSTSDVLVVVVALTEDTRGLLGKERLAALPRGAVVVNAARGGIVDEAALVELLDSGHLMGAALDVYDTEPLADRSPLRTHERVLLSPHVAGATVQSRVRILTQVTENLRRAITGEPVLDVVNGVDPMVRRR